jgi:hypothetical protein
VIGLLRIRAKVAVGVWVRVELDLLIGFGICSIALLFREIARQATMLLEVVRCHSAIGSERQPLP